ncbi:MAG: hypothetical protein AB8B93_10775 [Pseudomonadales bacterium]
MSSKFQAVSIRFSARACDAVKRAEQQRFLAMEAPGLPVSGCSSPSSCKCRYRHHPDRRDAMRRDSDYGLPGIFWTTAERRDGPRGRRASDSLPR